MVFKIDKFSHFIGALFFLLILTLKALKSPER